MGRPNSGQGPRPDRKGELAPGRTFARIVARTPDCRTLIISRPNNVLLIWREDDPETFTRLDLPDRIEGPIRPQSLALDPTGSVLYYVSRRGEDLRLTARPIAEPEIWQAAWTLPVSQPNPLAISPDGSTLAVAERSSAVVLVNASVGKVRDRLDPSTGDAGPIESITFSPDSRTLAVGLREHVRLWALGGKARPVARLPGLRGAVRALAFDTPGNRLAAADEKTVKLWDFRTLRAELARIGLDW